MIAKMSPYIGWFYKNRLDGFIKNRLDAFIKNRLDGFIKNQLKKNNRPVFDLRKKSI